MELPSSCRFAPASLSVGEVVSADLGGLLPRARNANGQPGVLELGPSPGVLLCGHGVGVHLGVALVVKGEDCLVETAVEEAEELKGALEAGFEVVWWDLEEGKEELLLCEESEELNSSSSAISPSSPLGRDGFERL